MPQVKKEDIRQRILVGAKKLFSENGYTEASIRNISSKIGLTPSHIYKYYPSKLMLFFAIYEPWWRMQIGQMQDELALIDSPRERLRHVVFTMWDRIPSEGNGAAHKMVEALTVAGKQENYNRELFQWTKSIISEAIKDCLPPSRQKSADHAVLAQLILMSFDGFTIERHRVGRPPTLDACIDTFVLQVLGSEPQTKISRNR